MDDGFVWMNKSDENPDDFSIFPPLYSAEVILNQSNAVVQRCLPILQMSRWL